MFPLIKEKQFFPAQWGIAGSDNPLGLRMQPGSQVFYVQSGHPSASNSNDGTDPDFPRATIAATIAQATAGRSDVIIVGPGHSENVATAGGITVNRSGLTILGVGEGQQRPRITFTNAAGSVIVSAANVMLENLLFLCGADSVAIMVDINADDCTLKRCEFRENTAVAQQFLTAVDVNGGGANAADRAKVLGCTFVSEAAGANQAIEIGAVQDGIVLDGNWITGDYAVAGIHSGSALTNLLLSNNFVRNVNAGDWAVELTAAATGMAVGNRFYSDAIATCFDPGSLMCADNLATDAIDQSASPIPVVAAVPLPDGSIGAATFAAGAIDAAAIANGAIDAATFAAGAIDAAAIANGAIDAATFAAGAIDAAAIANAAIDQATFADDTILGADNANNAFASTLVVNNRDGSLIERLEHLQNSLPQSVEKADGAILNGPDDLFVVSGGPVAVLAMYGLCSVGAGGAANCHLDHVVTDPAATIALSTDVAIGGLVAGGLITFTDVALPVLTITAAGTIVTPADNGHWLLTPGTMQAHCSAAQAGNIRWLMVYTPLSPNSMVTAAA